MHITAERRLGRPTDRARSAALARVSALDGAPYGTARTGPARGDAPTAGGSKMGQANRGDAFRRVSSARRRVGEVFQALGGRENDVGQRTRSARTSWPPWRKRRPSGGSKMTMVSNPGTRHRPPVTGQGSGS